MELATPTTPVADTAQVEEGVLSELEVEVVDLFVSVIRLLGVPKSIAEIYGLLYISPQPLALDAVVQQLRMSKGSASQGLKVLRGLGAIRPVYVAGDRRDHYTAETELKKLIGGLIREQVQPKLESGERRLERLRSAAKSSATTPQEAAFFHARIEKLAQWHTRSRSLIPLLTGMLE
ncbi:MAG: hypothetical protein KA004_10505 [Verrucomicrobiales bacterium]|nr:hypothetical protein [Verrucomicrobiales bacterium]